MDSMMDAYICECGKAIKAVNEAQQKSLIKSHESSTRHKEFITQKKKREQKQ